MTVELVTTSWRENRNLLLRRCMHWTGGNIREAEDLLSDAYLRALEAVRSSPVEVQAPIAWWTAIIANLARDRLRRARCRPFRDAPMALVEEVPDDAPSQEQLAAAREALERTVGGIQGLTSRQRAALTSRGIGDGYQHIARALGISSACARKMVQTAREKLRKKVPAGIAT